VPDLPETLLNHQIALARTLIAYENYDPSKVWCVITHKIPFEYGNYILEHHKMEIVRLPIGRCSIDDRLDYVIKLLKLGISPNAISRVQNSRKLNEVDEDRMEHE